MSGESKAVFLSYASEDAEAASRIADSLRAAGIEVWFDKSELRGGDAWDQAIRQRIRDCALFIPIVSRHSQARSEGYFRLEWRLADQRSQMMGRTRAFLVPVSIDDISEQFADVPDSFCAVQWTRLPGGASPSTFAARIGQLLAPPDSLASSNGPGESALTEQSQHVHEAPHIATPAPGHRTRAILIAAIATTGLIGLAYLGARSHLSGKPNNQAPATLAGKPAESPAPASLQSVAVLPFADLSEKRDQEYLADGMTEEIIERLSRAPNLHVAGRASSFYFKGKAITVAELARELGVANVVAGSVRRAGDHLRIGAQLVRAADGYTVWSETFNRKLQDVLTVQDDIAAAVAAALQITLSGGSLSGEQGGTRDLEAFQLTVQAKRELNQMTAESFARARTLAERAVSRDPGYGDAWAYMAWAWMDLGDDGAYTKSESCARMREPVAKAITNSPKSSTAHAVLANMYYDCDWNWPATRLEVKRSLALNPNDPEAMNVAGQLAITLGRYDEAEQTLRSALDRDPFQLYSRFNLGCALYLAGKYAQAEAEFRRVLEITSDASWARPWLAKTLVAVAKPREAFAELEPIINTDEGLNRLPVVLLANGKTAEAATAVNRLAQAHGKDSAFFIAEYYASANDRDQAMQWLERAYDQKDGWILWILGEPLMENLKGDARYVALLHKMNLFE